MDTFYLTDTNNRAVKITEQDHRACKCMLILLCKLNKSMVVNDRIRVNSLPNNKFLGCSKLRAFADSKCWLPAISPFPTMFSKGCLFRVAKSRDCALKS